VLPEIGPRELLFNSRAAHLGKIWRLRSARGAAVGQARGEKV